MCARDISLSLARAICRGTGCDGEAKGAARKRQCTVRSSPREREREKEAEREES